MFRMILPDTLPDLVGAEAPDGSPTRAGDADAAAARTRADYGRVSRWGLGLLGTAGAMLAILFAGVATSMLTSGGVSLLTLPFAALVLLVGIAFGVPSVWLLVELHRSGRRLARAAGYWAGLPYRQGIRSPTRGDWFAVRFLGFSSDLLLRLITSALAGLATIFAISGIFSAIAMRPSASGLVISIGLAILLGTVCAGQFGGVQRIQNGHLPRDPARLTGRG